MTLKSQCTREEAAEWAKLGAADLAADIVSIIKLGKNPEILETVLLRCERAMSDGIEVSSCKESDIKEQG